MDERISSVGYTRKSFASFLNCEPVHYQLEPLTFLHWTLARWKETLNQKDQVLVYEPWCIERFALRQHVHDMKAVAIP
jgi:hypothetical protein